MTIRQRQLLDRPVRPLDRSQHKAISLGFLGWFALIAISILIGSELGRAF